MLVVQDMMKLFLEYLSLLLSIRKFERLPTPQKIYKLDIVVVSNIQKQWFKATSSLDNGHIIFPAFIFV